jgi:hypothetical protein
VENTEGFPFGPIGAPTEGLATPGPPAPTVIGYVVVVIGNPVAVLKPPAPPPPQEPPPPPATTRYSTVPGPALETTKEPGEVKTWIRNPSASITASPPVAIKPIVVLFTLEP